MATTSEVIEQRSGHLRVAEDGGPFGEAEVGGDGNACALVELVQQMKEQSPTQGAEGEMFKLIQDQQIEACQVLSDFAPPCRASSPAQRH